MSKVVSGFILTKQWKDTAQGTKYVFWFATPFGPTKVELLSQESVFFVESEHQQKVELALSGFKYRVRRVSLKSFSQNSVNAIYFSSHRECRQAAKFLQSKLIEPYEYDVKPVDRYLMERFITTTANLSVSTETFSLTAPQQKLTSAKEMYHPKFKVISFDIETSMDATQLYSIAVIGGHIDSESSNNSEASTPLLLKHVILVSPTLNNENRSFTVELVKNEKQALVSFINLIKHFDPDIFLGWNCIDFDLQVLQKKADELRVGLPLGRDDGVIEWMSSGRDSTRRNVFIPGRCVLDGIDLLKTATYQFESFSLENVSRVVLDRGKLIHHVNDRGEEITRLYEEDQNSLIAYNIEDCALVWDIFIQCELITFAVKRSELTGLSLDRIGGSVAAFEYLYLPRLHRLGYVAPNIAKNPVGVGSPGGYVMSSLPGIYENVFVFDFKSLYPSIIQTFCIDPFGLMMGDSVSAEQKALLTSGDGRLDDYVPGFNGALFKVYQSILPKMIDDVWQARETAKKERNQPLSQALKIIMNSFYGVMGTPGCRFFDRRLPSSITLRGHEILTKTRAFFESKGLTVIYGDTDSIFVEIKGVESHAAANKMGNHYATKINQWWDKEISENFGVKSCLELEYEAHFVKFLMPTIRGSLEGSKKRYAGLKAKTKMGASGHVEVDYELVFKGLETVRSDWSPLARRFQRTLYEKIFYERPWKSFITETVDALRAGKFDDELTFRKRLRRPISEYRKNIPPHAQAAIKREAILEEQGKDRRYNAGGWIEYLYTINGPEPKEYRFSDIDYECYIEKQIKPIVDAVTVFLEGSPVDLVSNQMSLL